MSLFAMPSRIVGTAKLRWKPFPRGESERNGEVERAVLSVHGLREPSRTSWNTSPESLWNPEAHCCPGWLSIVPIFLWRVKTTERIVMNETGTFVVQSATRVPEEQRYDHRLPRNVRGTPWKPNPGDVSTDLPAPMLIIPQMPDVQPTPTRVCNSDNKGTRNDHIRKMDLERFGNTAGCRACEVHRAGQSMSGQDHTTACRKRLEDVMTTDTSTAARVKSNPCEARGTHCQRFG